MDDLVKRLRDYEEPLFDLGDVDQDDDALSALRGTW